LDDDIQIVNNPYLRSIPDIWHILTNNVWQSTAEGRESHIYRPIFLLSYWIDFQLFNLNPIGYHLHNNLLHAANVLLLLLLSLRFHKPQLAFLVAMIFAVHPIVTEGVNWAGSRMDLLATLFSLLTIHVLFRIFDAKQSLKFYTVIPLIFMIPLGLFSKEPYLLIPFVTLGMLALTEPRHFIKSRRFWLICLIVFIETILCLWWRGQFVDRSIYSLLNPIIFTNWLALLGRFSEIFIFPAETQFFYLYENSKFLGALHLLPSIFILFAIAYLIFFGRKEKGFVIGLGIFFASLAPVAMMLDILSLISERYFYLPFAGFSLALVSGLSALSKRYKKLWTQQFKKTLVVATIVWFIGLICLTTLRNREWRSPLTLYKAAVQKDNSNYLAHKILATVYLKNGKRDDEIRHYYAVLDSRPFNLHILNNLSVRLIEDGDYNQAKQLLKRAYQTNKSYLRTNYNLAYYYESIGKIQKAKDWYKQTLLLSPTHVKTRRALQRIEQDETLPQSEVK
jgi:tetratricopeptide (TPR) repeat protein